MPVPDESRAYLKVAASEVESEIWEWHNDLEAGDRLIRIRKRMKRCRTQGCRLPFQSQAIVSPDSKPSAKTCSVQLG